MASYISESDASTYFSTRFNTGAWDAASSAERTKALGHGTLIIDQLAFTGSKTSDLQVNQFPRDGAVAVPLDVQYACAEIALALLDGVNPEEEFNTLRLVKTGYGQAETNLNAQLPEHILMGVPSITAWRYLKQYVVDRHSIRLERL